MQSEMAAAGNQGMNEGLERESQEALNESPQKEGQVETQEEQPAEVDGIERIGGKILDSPQNEHHQQSRTEFASPVSAKNFNHSLMSAGLNQKSIKQQQMLSLDAADIGPSEAFVANSNYLKDMFSATTLTQLFSGSSSSLKKIFKVSKVNFLLVCKDAMKIFKQEDG